MVLYIYKCIYYPPYDSKKEEHELVSCFKAGVRIVGYFFIPFNLVAATALLILSEVIGIIEEMV